MFLCSSAVFAEEAKETAKQAEESQAIIEQTMAAEADAKSPDAAPGP